MAQVYHPVQRALHWAVAGALALAAPLGLMVGQVSDEETRALTGGGLGLADTYWWHKSFGFLVLFLMVLRVAARLRFGEPPHDPPLGRRAALGAAVTHRALYLLLLLLPMLGWIGTSAFGPGVATFFGLTMPDLVAQDRDLSAAVLGLHGLLAFAALGLIAAHLGAAAWHGWVKRDNVVQRMTGSAGRED